MRAKLTVPSAVAVAIIGGVFASACQTYDFEPVEPLALAQTTVGGVISAKSLKPNLMVLLDTSGSMTLPVNPDLADCKDPSKSPPNNLCGSPGNIACDVSKCPTRWSELRGAMSSFLTNNGTVARMGLTTFPAPALASDPSELRQCIPSRSVQGSESIRIAIPDVDDTDTAALQSTATQISNLILSIPLNGDGGPVGGTPTGHSIQFVGSQPSLQGTDRQDFILLLTDGLPNCNPDNPNSGADPDKCQCTLAACTGGAATLGCLDQDASVTAIQALRNDDKLKDIRTIVVGFGAETVSGSAPATLNAMAQAGGFARNCTKSDDACGAGDTCDPVTKLCGRRFYQAANQTELATALSEIINLVGTTDPCLLGLQPDQLPSDPSLIAVYVNGEVVAPGDDTWKLTAEGVQFQGAMCTRILASTEANPITLEARAVQRK